MAQDVICCVCRSEAVRYAAKYLVDSGYQVTEEPAPNVTHLLLPVPSFPTSTDYLAHYLDDVPNDVIIAGGNLDSPLLGNYQTVDFLRDPYYLAENAAITASCALQIAEEKVCLAGCHVLVLGWGRIGKCLGKLLQSKGADVTIAARKDADLAMIRALGYHSFNIGSVDKELTQYQVIMNTVPAMVLPEMDTAPDTLILELASTPGMAGDNIIPARGLPGKMAPAASGKLIADTLIRLLL